nr:putative ribonuclease H-like domain-containing protein [Tanacetum cinerariifolium]GEZ26858.1 putative ribonuclease H-like domain-containing protein [Tanacetum cinerariifolium]GEZ26862.1 putative ribonuclease H-like domain-containing protein [Tanacetum cinerariifolium]GEZ26871.1 putative ribonuclease H-like domain-containing protein [Tanacetum cinerariifolium]GEZ26873.1 putative ribonuclease H-like domain-containing protein [Tanacetum cinerariifolium]
FLGCRLISWQCKKQIVVATSSTEAEYVAAASGCAQVLWMQSQLLDYGVFNSPMLHVLRVEMVIYSPWMLSKNWLVQKQTALGKDTSNPFMADNLPKIFWNTAVVKHSGDVTRLQALVDKKRIVITEEVIHEILQLNDAEGVICLPNDEIFAGLARMGYEKPSTKLTFYKAFFLTQWKFLIHMILHSLSAKRTSWNKFSSAMASALICLSSEEVATDVVPPTPTSPLPSSPAIPSTPPHQSPCPPQPQDAKGSSHLFQQVLDTCSALVLRVEDDVENVFNQGRISVDMDQDEGIELLVDHEKDAEVEGRHAEQAEIYNIDLDHSSKVLSMKEDDTEVQEAVEVVTTAKLITEVVTAAATQEELDKEHEEAYKQIDWNAALDHVQSKEPQEEMEKENEEIVKSINETPAQKAVKRRKLSEEAQEADDLKKRLEIVVVIDNKPKYKIIRADDTHQFYISFTTLLKNFDREDLETFWRIIYKTPTPGISTRMMVEHILCKAKDQAS